MPMLDPYLRWAELTGFRDVARDSQGRVGVIIECSGTVAELQQQISKGRLPGVQLPALYREGGVVAAEDLHYCTAWVERDHLQALAGQVKRFKLGMAMDGYEPPSAPRPSRHCSARVVIGIIDDFVAFAHPAFAAANGDSRVRFVWSQDATGACQSGCRVLAGLRSTSATAMNWSSPRPRPIRPCCHARPTARMSPTWPPATGQTRPNRPPTSSRSTCRGAAWTTPRAVR